MNIIYEPAKILIGTDSLQQLPEMVRAYGSKPLLVHGHHPVENGLLEKVRTVLMNAKIPYANMGEILPNPKYSSVKRGVKIAKKEKCDLILSLGGGSTLQCAKGIAYGLKYDGHLWDLWLGKEKPKKMAAVAAVLTNPASGDELNNACTLVKDGKEKTLISDVGHCSFAILDPSLSALPMYPCMCECFELMMYLFSRWLQASSTEKSIDLCLMQNQLENIKTLKNDLNNVDAINGVFWVSTMIHMLHQKGNSDFTDLAGRVSFKESLARGAAMSALFSGWWKYLEKSEEKQLASLGPALFKLPPDADAKACEQAFAQLIKEMQLPQSLGDAGLHLEEKDIHELAKTKEDEALLNAAA